MEGEFRNRVSRVSCKYSVLSVRDCGAYAGPAAPRVCLRRLVANADPHRELFGTSLLLPRLGERVMAQGNATTQWPPLPYEEWRETAATLHLWLQIVGKIQLMHRPWVNHSWHVTLHNAARGLGTSLIWHEKATCQIDFDFIDHRLIIRVADGRDAMLPLEPQTTATFY